MVGGFMPRWMNLCGRMGWGMGMGMGFSGFVSGDEWMVYDGMEDSSMMILLVAKIWREKGKKVYLPRYIYIYIS